jgi:hypothetical protein
MIKRWILPLGSITLFQLCRARQQFSGAIGQSIAQIIIDSEMVHFSGLCMANSNMDAIDSGKFWVDIRNESICNDDQKKDRAIYSGFAHIQL